MGGINYMMTHGVSADFMVHTTGHDMTGISTLWHYAGATVPLSLPGSMALVGWHPPPYGQAGPSPRPPSLQPLIDIRGVDAAALAHFADIALYLHAGAHPSLLVNGPLRQLTNSMCASLIMYYDDATQAGEAMSVMRRLEKALVDAKLSRDVGQAKLTLSDWGVTIRAAFEGDNAEMRGPRQSADGSVQIISALQSLTQSFNKLGTDMTSRLQELNAKFNGLQTKVQGIEGKVVELSKAVSSRGLKSPSSSHTSPEQPAEPAAAAGDEGASAAASGQGAGAEPGSSEPQPGLAGGVPRPIGLLGDALVPHKRASLPITALKGLSAVDCMLDEFKKQLRVTDSDQSRLDTCKNVFKNVASDAELQLLRDQQGNMQEQVRTLQTLETRLIGRFLQEYDNAGREAPTTLKTWKAMGVNAATDRLTELCRVSKAASKRVLTSRLSAAEIAALPTKPATAPAKRGRSAGASAAGSGGSGEAAKSKAPKAVSDGKGGKGGGKGGGKNKVQSTLPFPLPRGGS